MTPAEVIWRARSSSRNMADRALVAFRRNQPRHIGRITRSGDERGVGHFDNRLFPGKFEEVPLRSPRTCWRDRILGRANDLLENRWSFLHLDRVSLGPQVDWNYEYSAKRATPKTFSPSIDYRDFNVTGDAKVVWEPNRHQHLVVLALAFQLTGDQRYSEKVVEQIESWIQQCPFGHGMNWRSPLELAIRLINWVWALGAIMPSGVLTSERAGRLLSVAYQHLWEINRKYSRFSSANNHLIGEAAGVFIGCSFFRSLKRADEWRREAARILATEIERQTLGDGGNCELSSTYHLFALEFFLLAGITGRRTGFDFGPTYWKRLEDMFSFVGALLEGGDQYPMLGDSDDGYVLDLEARDSRVRSLLSVGSRLFEREDLRKLGEGNDERAYWLLGRESLHTPAYSRRNGSSLGLRSRKLALSGYYVLQAGNAERGDGVSIIFDAGDLGFGSIAAHGHADALSFLLRAFGTDVIIDPGTYDYFSYPEWRDYFRSTRAHNTIVVDGKDQSEMRGPFLWGRRAVARCLAWEPTDSGGMVCGEHDGYGSLTDPVIHRRTIQLNAAQGRISIHDELEARNDHHAEFCLHFAEHCRVVRSGSNSVRIDVAGGRVDIELDSRLGVKLARGEVDPPEGWVSRGYHQKCPSTSLFATCQWSGRLDLRTRVDFTKLESDFGESPEGETTTQGART